MLDIAPYNPKSFILADQPRLTQNYCTGPRLYGTDDLEECGWAGICPPRGITQRETCSGVASVNTLNLGRSHQPPARQPFNRWPTLLGHKVTKRPNAGCVDAYSPSHPLSQVKSILVAPHFPSIDSISLPYKRKRNTIHWKKNRLGDI